MWFSCSVKFERTVTTLIITNDSPIGISLDTWVGTTVFALTVASGLAYNWYILTRLDELRT